ncbi:MAG: hypothetical protein DSZ29_06390 [Aquificaceae bacterium]|nr:MAG: hypothetical protein DSZ29_06390 [Aquificaceae bacterium]
MYHTYLLFSQLFSVFLMLLQSILKKLRNVHKISSTTFITQNFYFRLDDLVRRIVILRNEQDHLSWDKKAS